MSEPEPKPVRSFVNDSLPWLAIVVSQALSHAACWLLITGMLYGLVWNQKPLGWRLGYFGWLLGGLGGSLFVIVTVLIASTRKEITSRNPEWQMRSWRKVGFFVLLAVIAGPILAPFAIGFAFIIEAFCIIWTIYWPLVLLLAVVYWPLVLLLAVVNKILGFGGSDKPQLNSN